MEHLFQDSSQTILKMSGYLNSYLIGEMVFMTISHITVTVLLTYLMNFWWLQKYCIVACNMKSTKTIMNTNKSM